MDENQKPTTRREAVKKMALGTAGVIASLLIPRVAQATYASQMRSSYFSCVYTSFARYSSYSYSSLSYSSFRYSSNSYSSYSSSKGSSESFSSFMEKRERRQFEFVSPRVRAGKSYQQIADEFNAYYKLTGFFSAVGVERIYLEGLKKYESSSK